VRGIANVRSASKKSSSGSVTKINAVKSIKSTSDKNAKVSSVSSVRNNATRDNVVYYGTQGNAALKPVPIPTAKPVAQPVRRIVVVPKSNPSLVPMAVICITFLFISSVLSLCFSTVMIPSDAYKMSELERQTTVLTTEIEALNEAVQRKNNDL
jgi:hypothetical protein